MEKRKVAIIFAAFFISGNARGVSRTENYKDIVEKAQNLILQRDRPQALNLLDQTLRQESQKASTNQEKTLGLELRKQMSSISRIFLVEKAQQAYELALSLKRQDLGQALIQIRIGLKLEPDNLNLQLEEGRIQLVRSDCSGALEAYSKIHKSLLQDEEVALLAAQQSLCNHEKDSTNKPGLVIYSNSKLKLFWGLVELEQSFLEKNEIRSKEIIKTLGALNSQHPDLIYWQYRSLPKTDTNRGMLAQKYLLSCQNLSKRQLREFSLDPYLCLRTPEVEQELKKVGAPNEN